MSALSRLTRAEIIAELEAEGFACYAHESTELLRETLEEDRESRRLEAQKGYHRHGRHAMCSKCGFPLHAHPFAVCK